MGFNTQLKFVDLLESMCESWEDKIKKLKSNEKPYKSIEEKLNNLNEQDVVVNFIKNIVRNLKCKIYKDGMVSGSAVVADGNIVEQNIKQRKVNGIDMEAYGVTYACNHSKQQPKILIIKSICDFADEEKNDIYQTMASFASAGVFYEIFTKHIDF